MKGYQKNHSFLEFGKLISRKFGWPFLSGFFASKVSQLAKGMQELEV